MKKLNCSGNGNESLMSSNVAHENSLDRAEVSRRLNPHLLTRITLPLELTVNQVNPQTLLSMNRLDVIAKYIYAKSYLKGCADGWPLDLYREHLRVFNNFTENDCSGKQTFEDFLSSFKQLIDSMRTQGFDDSQSLIPVDTDGVIIDGAHRLATCLALELPAHTVVLDYHNRHYGPNYFLAAGMDINIVETLILQHIALQESTRVAVVFPVVWKRLEAIRSMISSEHAILHTKQLNLTERGKANFIRSLYQGEEWVASHSGYTPAVLHTVTERFQADNPVVLMFFEEPDLSIVRALKEEIRATFDLGNLPVHINDYHEEALHLAQLTLNKNSMHWLNFACPEKTPHFRQLFDRAKTDASFANPDAIALDSSAVLAAYGIRDVADLDILKLDEGGGSALDDHDDQLVYHSHSKLNLILNPAYFFWFEGVKFLSLQIVRSMKLERNDPKDRIDLELIERILETNNSLLQRLRLFTLKFDLTLVRIKARIRHALIRWLPPAVKKALRIALNSPFFISQMIGPEDRVMHYHGFELHYRSGTSLIRRIQNGEIYEPKTASAIVNALRAGGEGLYVDVGAHIGLTILNVLYKLPETSVVAFEAGPHQRSYLIKTVKANALEQQVSVQPYALSNREGTVNFYVHNHRHTSGDGFLDTGRAGSTRTITVNTITLDSWWHSNDCPPIKVIKIDTEGAELWVLEGGERCITQERPTLIIEINPENLKPFPHSAHSLLQKLTDLQYELYALNGTPVSFDSIDEILKQTDEFIAYPLPS